MGWSLVMLLIVFCLVSLFLMQIIVAGLEETGETMDSELESMFGSVGGSILTLFRASTGGDDWGLAYEAIGRTGLLGSAVYLIFIAFVQFALINIITGIFVESAMETLSPDKETLALEHSRKEQENADELEALCRNVDIDFSGKLTREQ